jgi:ribonuclease J
MSLKGATAMTTAKQTLKRPRDGCIRLVPLGGLGEIGKNMMVIESHDDLVLIDSGLMFPQEEMPGIDLVLPDYSYVLRNADRLRGIVLTHGHEDHIGSLPYLLREVKAPVYGSKLTLGLLKPKLEEMRIAADLREINERSRVRLGPFTFEFIPQIHSIPDGMALAIETPHGTIVHTGDFKFDQTPLAGQRVRYDRLTALGKKGVLLLLSDSTNASEPGFTPPERVVAESLRELFKRAPGAVIVASFASHIHRIQQIIDVARETGRYVAVSGRSMRQSIRVASETGHLSVEDGIVVDIHTLKDIPRKKICVLSTGSQGEPLSALSLIASREHRHVSVKEGDTVIIAASPIPGNERNVSSIIDRLMKQGAYVYYQKDHRVHVSGHASQEELRLMLNLIRPQYFVPIHGEYRHLRSHAELAYEVGIPHRNVFILENGDTIEITASGVRRGPSIEAGTIYVDGLGIGDIKDVVLRDRQHLSQDGIVIVVIAVNELDGDIVQGPDIISRGVTYNDEELHAEAHERVRNRVLKLTQQDETTDIAVLKNEIKNVLSNFIYEKTRRRPMIIPVVIEV